MKKATKLQKFRIQLQKNQIITLSSLENLDLWKLRYPDLKILKNNTATS